MTTLTLNAGSSSLRFAVFGKGKTLLFKGHIDGVTDHKKALAEALKEIQESGCPAIKKVMHRVVHGGEKYKKKTLLNPRILKQLESLSPLAPLHNPANLEGIRAAMKLLPKATHNAVFDTAFHATLPEKAFLYGLPYSLYKTQKIRRYGFHGTSHSYVSKAAIQFLKEKDLAHASLISCHLGNGVSITAIKDGKSVDTSMGFTPLEGPLMGTRSGSVDPAILLHLQKQGMKKDKLEHMLQKESGFLGLSELSSDIRVLHKKPKNPGTRRAFEVFSYQVAKLISGYTVALNAFPDAIIFTAGIGESAHYLRSMICDHLKAFGLRLDAKKNESVQEQDAIQVISAKNSFVSVLVIPTDEEREMAST
jgi:acetate kinase